ncbi:MAG: cytochrome b/b6 domain-containing protein [Lamprobacter sp.]|uniref:cytochrome b/b6 domain-containing protein n=1 Tax=Lamprobacter sp. TaxID=3100796 RepID=UPI002B264566|nr:cytochrome b/b6 domain-containing protein [Lamprobacter sp.]MEA3641530.1 cytochrome b/b6 domain-containing protein [Lamprobacter sp.]
MSRLYLYPIWLRLWHWLNALLFLTLLITGVSMHFSLGWLIPFDVAVPIHNSCGMLLSLSWLVFVVGNLWSGNSKHYRVNLRRLPGDLIAQTRYYLHGIFVGAPHPFHVSADQKLNALQTLSYIGVMYGLMPILVISGWAFLFSTSLPETLFGVGTVWIIAITHLVVAWMLALFLIVHMYIITTGETPTTNLKAMVTGWHKEESSG